MEYDTFGLLIGGCLLYVMEYLRSLFDAGGLVQDYVDI